MVLISILSDSWQMINPSSFFNETPSHQSIALNYYLPIIAINLHWIRANLFEKSSHEFPKTPTYDLPTCTFRHFSRTPRRDCLNITKYSSNSIEKTPCLMYTQNPPPSRYRVLLILRDNRIMINPLFTSILIRILEPVFRMIYFLLPPHTHPWYNLRKTPEGRLDESIHTISSACVPRKEKE
jgi:hypothetical protein